MSNNTVFIPDASTNTITTITNTDDILTDLLDLGSLNIEEDEPDMDYIEDIKNAYLEYWQGVIDTHEEFLNDEKQKPPHKNTPHTNTSHKKTQQKKGKKYLAHIAHTGMCVIIMSPTVSLLTDGFVNGRCVVVYFTFLP